MTVVVGFQEFCLLIGQAVIDAVSCQASVC